MPPATNVDWHCLFGLILADFFTGSPFEVQTEIDLSVQQQFLDLIIVRKRKGKPAEPLPDGLDDLAEHNLLTFKSHHEPLEDRHLRELTAHFVAYQKLQTPRGQPPLPEGQFRLYAVCSREPAKLSGQVDLVAVQPGVYECRRGTDRFRVVVANQLPHTKNNTALHLFAASAEQVAFGAANYKLRSETTSTVIRRLFEGYEVEGLEMPYSLEEFYKEFVQTHSDELLRMMSPEQRVEGLSAEQLEQLLSQKRAAEAAKSAKPAGGAKKRRSK